MTKEWKLGPVGVSWEFKGLNESYQYSTGLDKQENTITKQGVYKSNFKGKNICPFRDEIMLHMLLW